MVRVRVRVKVEGGDVQGLDHPRRHIDPE